MNEEQVKDLHKPSVLFGLMLAVEHIEECEQALTATEAVKIVSVRTSLENRISAYADQIIVPEGK